MPPGFEVLARLCRSLLTECGARKDYGPAIAVVALCQSYYQLGSEVGADDLVSKTAAAATPPRHDEIQDGDTVVPSSVPPPGRKELLKVAYCFNLIPLESILFSIMNMKSHFDGIFCRRSAYLG
jgi:hypothetical protein